MLAIQNPGDWIETIIVVVIIAGSALSGIGKAIISKINRSREEAEAERERQGRPRPQRVKDHSPPPVARPMPPRHQPPVVMQRTMARPLNQPAAPQRPMAEIPKSFQPVVQTILDVMLDGAVDVEDVLGRPQPRPGQPQPPPVTRPVKTKAAKSTTRRRSIEDREEQKAKLVEKRIGHVQQHIASTTPTESEFASFERPTRSDLRRAIILNEILSPPLALRPPA